VKVFGLDVETIQTRFGGIPRSLPAPALPDFSLEKVVAVLPDSFTFALLGGIESLLSAVVADSMTGRRHRSNCELVAQGIANVAASIFGGIVATGTIARTATNIRAGARSPVAGMLHSLFLLTFMAVAAPLAGDIPLAALSAILIVVAWNMAERAEFVTLIRASRADALVLLSTFGLTIFRDLTEAIVVGVVLGSLVFMHRMSEAIQVQTHVPLVEEDKPDAVSGRPDYDLEITTDPDIVVHRIAGAFFFGASSTVAAVLERINLAPKAFILDLGAVPFIDSSGAHSLKGFIDKAHRKGAVVYLTGASADVHSALERYGIQTPLVVHQPTVEASIAAARKGKELPLQ
ncbi:MAG: SulP family inorganic anion transporter, partial [Parvibaculaceae bacterium]